MSLDRLWAGWRAPYIEAASAGDELECVLCRLAASDDDTAAMVVYRGMAAFCVLNAYPYTNGHVMISPLRHVADLELLEPTEATDLWSTVTLAVQAVKAAYRPGGINIGANLGRPAGAGVPGHLHVHVLPRWNGDTNFMTSVAEARVLPEALSSSWERIRAAWPA